MAERPRLMRRTSTHDKLLHVMKSDTPPASPSLLSPPLSPSTLVPSLSSPTLASPSLVSSLDVRRSPSGNPRRVLKREVAMRQLPIRLIAQRGVPSAKQMLRTATVSVFEWAQSIGLATKDESLEVKPEAKVEQKPTEKGEQKLVEQVEQKPVVAEEDKPAQKEEEKPAEKELLEDASLNIFLDAWNQLDAHEENLSVQTEIKQATVEHAALEALKEQNILIDAPVAVSEASQSTATVSSNASSSLPETMPAIPSAATIADIPSEAVASVGVMKPDVIDDVPSLSTTVSEASIEDKQSAEVPSADKIVDQAQEVLEPSSLPDQAAADSSYTGPHYEAPITQSFVEALIQYFATSGLNAKLPYAYAHAIFQETYKVLQAEPTILDISIPKGGSVVVCGDTHGQFPDLITILRDTGFPSASKIIIFNGDFVDRGPAGAELLLTLYSLKLLFPKYIYLHRGNHEQDYVNKTYNFEKQVLQKYDEAMYDLIHDTFGQLPLGCVIAEKVLVIHGGLPEDTELSVADFKALPKLRDIPVGKGKNANEKAIEDLLWGDPKDRKGIRASKRGAGVEFGPDITASFISRNNLELIVRSHELMTEGFGLTHNNQVMTIFSASYYCSSNTNKGAFLIFEDGHDVKVPSVVQFYSQAFSAKDNVLKSCVKETLEKLRERIHASRHALMAEFAQRDKDCSGSVSEHNWSAAMASGLGIQIEWSGMLPYLAKVEDNGKILYAKFLARYKPKPPPSRISYDDDDDEDEEAKKEEKIRKMKHKRQLRNVCTKLLTFGGDIDTVFTAIDENKDERIDYLEFYNTLSSFGLGLTDDQIYDMMFLLDDDHHGLVDRIHFTNYFKNQFERVALIARDTWLHDAVVAASNALSKEFDYLSSHKMRLKSGFRKVPTDDDGFVTHELFAKWIVRTLHMDSFVQAERMKIAMYVDFNNNGKISWREFKRAFMSLDGTDSLPEDVLLDMCEVVAKNKAQLLRAFQGVDTNGTGTLDVPRFKAGLAGLNVLLDHPLSETQIKKLHQAIAKDGGEINYSEFLNTFAVKDATKMKHIAEGVKNM